MPQQQKPNFIEGIENLVKQRQQDHQKIKHKTFQQQLSQRGSRIDDVTPPKFKMGEPVYFVKNKQRYEGVITQVPSVQTQVLNTGHNVFVPWKTLMEKNPLFQDIPGSGSVWNMGWGPSDGERLYLIKLDDNKTISYAYESDLFSNVRQQSLKHKTFQQQLSQRGSRIDDVTPPKFKMGEPVYFVKNKQRYKGLITQVPSVQTQVLNTGHNVFVPWKTLMEKNPLFQDIPGSGSVWNMGWGPSDGERLYLIKLDDNKTISYAYESDLFSNVRQQSLKHKTFQQQLRQRG